MPLTLAELFSNRGVQKRCYLGVKWLVNPWLVEWQCKVCRNVKKLIRSVQMRLVVHLSGKKWTTLKSDTKNVPPKKVEQKWTTLKVKIVHLNDPESSYRVFSIG